MPLITKAVRGTKDLLPENSHEIRWLERAALETAEQFGFYELRTPVFEHTELFLRGVGDTTDVVQKEMYTFDDKGGRSLTLRPEGTAGAARACIEHGLLDGTLPCKVSYLTTCYRYEKPQAGRYREFEQFGVECFGAAAPAADAELISLLITYLTALDMHQYRLEINTIGCPDCRKDYTKKLQDYFAPQLDALCSTCQARFARNPMRILDCKSPVCHAIAENAPNITDSVCADCAAHFEQVRSLLNKLEIPFTVNPKIVRGLDYYTRTVFECISEASGTEGLVLSGGGRYDGLVAELGGSPVPGIGFGVGLDRILLAAKAEQVEIPERVTCELYIAPMGAKAQETATILAAEVRDGGWNVQTDIMGRSLKAQMKYADKIGALYAIVLGDSELESNAVTLKSMHGGESKTVRLTDFLEEFEKIMLQSTQAELYKAMGIEAESDLGD
jgi:histidyl-tRNA synthetase